MCAPNASELLVSRQATVGGGFNEAFDDARRRVVVTPVAVWTCNMAE
jgi:hypothetical protein